MFDSTSSVSSSDTMTSSMTSESSAGPSLISCQQQQGVVIATEAGVTSPVRARITIDATGNADVADTSTDSVPSLTYRGQLKISLRAGGGVLTVNVIKGKNLSLSQDNGESFDSYVKAAGCCDTKVCLVPDDTKKTHCKTDVIRDAANPVFREKFSFELLDEDYAKRVYLSAWKKDPYRNKCEFLGGLSFGIQEIYQQRQCARDYYYLLPSEVGRHQHIRLSSADNWLKTADNTTGTHAEYSSFIIRTYSVGRNGDGGFGFSISVGGGRIDDSVRVSRVDVESDARRVGLQVGDELLSIDAVSVEHLTVNCVAATIRKAGSETMLTVRRWGQSTPASTSSSSSSSVAISPAQSPHCSLLVTRGDTAAVQRQTSDSVVRLRCGRRPAASSSTVTTDYGWVDVVTEKQPSPARTRPLVTRSLSDLRPLTSDRHSALQGRVGAAKVRQTLEPIDEQSTEQDSSVGINICDKTFDKFLERADQAGTDKENIRHAVGSRLTTTERGIICSDHLKTVVFKTASSPVPENCRAKSPKDEADLQMIGDVSSESSSCRKALTLRGCTVTADKDLTTTDSVKRFTQDFKGFRRGQMTRRSISLPRIRAKFSFKNLL